MLVREILFSSGTLSLFESSAKERMAKRVLFLKQEDIAPFGCPGRAILSQVEQGEQLQCALHYLNCCKDGQ